MKKEKNFLISFEETLKERDLDTLSQRALRLEKLEPFRISKVATIRVFDHVNEAKQSFINGCYRSSIICSSNAVEQSFMHMLIENSEDWERTYWEIEIKQMTFKTIIEEAEKRKIRPLTRFIKDAHWIRRVRNAVVAHPSYIAELSEHESPDRIIWANKLMLRDLRELVQFFDPLKRKQIEMKKLTSRTQDGKIVGESETLKEILANPKKIEVGSFFDWWGFQKGLLIDLALEVYERMSKILNGIHEHENPKSG